jgi:putative endonuclease
MVYSVYLLANRSKTLYTGVTNNLVRRVWQHKKKEISGSTGSYNIDCLVLRIVRRSPICDST